MPQRAKPSATKKADNTQNAGEPLDTAAQALQIENQEVLERQTAAYFQGVTPPSAAEEADLENALTAISQKFDFDQP